MSGIEQPEGSEEGPEVRQVPPVPPARARSGSRVLFAIVLIVVGIAGIAAQVVNNPPDIGGWIVLVIGLGFMGAFVYTRQFGFLVPGGIMTGLGAGIVASRSLTLTLEQAGGTVVLGLGVGFVSIWLLAVLAHVPERHRWPLIPGAILGVAGVALLIGGQALTVLNYWGVAVVALGLFLLWRSWGAPKPQG